MTTLEKKNLSIALCIRFFTLR